MTEWKVTDSAVVFKKWFKEYVIPFEEIIEVKLFGASNGVFDLKTAEKEYLLLFNINLWDKAKEAYDYVLKCSPKAYEQFLKDNAEKEAKKKEHETCFSNNYRPRSSDNKDASVVGRAVVGGVVAGPVGAIVGALSAVDKNNRKKR